jgi:hypothetical protein
MSLGERTNFNKISNRIKLDVGVLGHKHGKQQSSNTSKSDEIESISNDKRDILDIILETYEKHLDFYRGHNLDTYDKYIIDSIIDRLDNYNYIRLVEQIAVMQNTNIMTDLSKKCLRSLIEAGVILLDDKDKIQYVYNHYDGEMYCLRSDNMFKRCSPLELNKVSKEVANIKQKMGNTMEDTVRGHIEFTGKKGGCDFKIRDNPKTSGYVCWKTSSLSLEDLIRRIKELDNKINLENLIKKDMCFVYELVLRAQGKKGFKRSIVKKLK